MNSKSNRNKYWHNIVEKCGYYGEVIWESDVSMKKEDAWEEAGKKEIEFIKKYGRQDLGEGCLVNMTDGGEGVIGHNHSNATREMISKTLKEKYRTKQLIPHLYGKTLSEETKQKISKAQKGISKPIPNEKTRERMSQTRIERKLAVGENNGMYGRKHSHESRYKMGVNRGRKFSEEVRKRMGDGHRGLKRTEQQKMNMRLSSTTKKPVIQMNMNGIFIAEWDGIKEAARQTNSNQSGISSCCIGNRRHHNGYKWKYKI
jgi:hypothetical protein